MQKIQPLTPFKMDLVIYSNLYNTVQENYTYKTTVSIRIFSLNDVLCCILSRSSKPCYFVIILMYICFVLPNAKLHLITLNYLATNHISLNKYFTKAAKLFRLV